MISTITKFIPEFILIIAIVSTLIIATYNKASEPLTEALLLSFWSGLFVSSTTVVGICLNVVKEFRVNLSVSLSSIRQFCSHGAENMEVVTAAIIFIPNLSVYFCFPRTHHVASSILRCQLLICSHIFLAKAVSGSKTMGAMLYGIPRSLALLVNSAGFVLWFYSMVDGSVFPFVLAIVIHGLVCAYLFLHPANIIDEVGSASSDVGIDSHTNISRASSELFYKQLYGGFIACNWVIFLGLRFGARSDDFARDDDYLHEYLISFAIIAIQLNRKEELRDDVKTTETASTMNRDFVRYISHELRSHLSHLTLGLQHLGLDVDESNVAAQKMLQELQETCEECLQILNDILVNRINDVMLDFRFYLFLVKLKARPLPVQLWPRVCFFLLLASSC